MALSYLCKPYRSSFTENDWYPVAHLPRSRSQWQAMDIDEHSIRKVRIYWVTEVGHHSIVRIAHLWSYHFSQLKRSNSFKLSSDVELCKIFFERNPSITNRLSWFTCFLNEPACTCKVLSLDTSRTSPLFLQCPCTEWYASTTSRRFLMYSCSSMSWYLTASRTPLQSC